MADGERLVIDHVGHHGDGVAIAGGGNIYVPYTLGGETIEVAAVPGHHPDRRRLLKVEAASVERIAPFCPHFGVCGGCAIQHWDAAPYRAWKRGFGLVEIPIIFVDRTEGVSKMSKKIVREAIWMVWRLRWWSLTGRI